MPFGFAQGREPVERRLFAAISVSATVVSNSGTVELFADFSPQTGISMTPGEEFFDRTRVFQSTPFPWPREGPVMNGKPLCLTID